MGSQIKGLQVFTMPDDYAIDETGSINQLVLPQFKGNMVIYNLPELEVTILSSVFDVVTKYLKVWTKCPA